MKLIDGIEWNPIAFVDQLIIEIQADRKLETRRVARINRDWSVPPAQFHDGYLNRFGANSDERVKCPYGKVGGRLWVRERFACFDGYAKPCKISDATYVVFRDGFRKDFDRQAENGIYEQKERLQHLPENVLWRPPMHLPFCFHRIDLETTGIKVERLQQITEAGAIAEGFQAGLVRNHDLAWATTQAGLLKEATARDQFRDKWDLINGKRSDRKTGFEYTWENNPLVWCIKFKRLKG